MIGWRERLGLRPPPAKSTTATDRTGAWGEAVAANVLESRGITPDKDIITYCRIGERSSHTWFVLTYLLGYPNVRNYDGSWTEWGNLVDAPIER